jgi:hypothetical protein
MSETGIAKAVAKRRARRTTSYLAIRRSESLGNLDQTETHYPATIALNPSR